MKIAFIGEAVSGFGGMETVISNVIHTFENSSPKINCEMFFFCRNDKMDKAWLKEIKYAQSFSNIKLSFLRRAKHVYNFSQWLKETSPYVLMSSHVFMPIKHERKVVNSLLFSRGRIFRSTIKNMQNV